jgi:hypothetical protein
MLTGSLIMSLIPKVHTHTSFFFNKRCFSAGKILEKRRQTVNGNDRDIPIIAGNRRLALVGIF